MPLDSGRALVPAADRPLIEMVRVEWQPRMFLGAWQVLHVPAGETVAGIVADLQPEPALRPYYCVTIGGHLIPPEFWRSVRPKAGTTVRVGFAPRGGGALRIVAMVGIALAAIATTALTGGALGPAWAAALGAGVSLIGSLALNAFLPPPTPKLTKNIGQDSPTYSISGARNQFDPWGVVPLLLGKFRVVPKKSGEFRETEGANNYLRITFVFGTGPITISDLKIGETPISNYQGVETEFRRGYQSTQLHDAGNWSPAGGSYPASPSFGYTYLATTAGTVGGVAYVAGDTITFNGLAAAADSAAWDLNQSKPFKLFPNDVYDDAQQVRLTNATAAQVRTTQKDCAEVIVDLYFPQGLFHLQNSPPGALANNAVTVVIDMSPTGANTWTPVVTRTVSAQNRAPFFWSYRWKVDPATATDGQFDVRIQPTSGHDGARNIAECYWSSLKTVAGELSQPIPGVAEMAMRIKASGQLSGTLEEFNVVAQSICKYWDKASQTWKVGPTSTPAALDRWLVQHPLCPYRLSDAQVDLQRLQEWSEYCDDRNLQFNGYIDFDTALGQLREDIARTGHAAACIRDMRRSVVIERPQSVPVRMFTPRNTWGFEADLAYPDPPHAFRVALMNAARGWAPDEVLVYDDEHDDDTATLYERIEPLGITDAVEAHKYGRRELARRRVQREIVRFLADFETLACERGDLIAFQQDGMSVGLGSGRVVSRAESGGRVTAVTLDERLTLQPDTSYVVRVRRVVSGAMRTDLYTVAAPDVETETAVLTLAAPPLLADAPAVGDLAAFGISGKETTHLVIKDIEPVEEMAARITCVQPLTYTDGMLPVFSPDVTATMALPAPVVTRVLSDASVMVLGPNRSLITRVVFEMRPIEVQDLKLYVWMSLSGEDDVRVWTAATIDRWTAREVIISGIDDGRTYDFRLQYSHPDYFSSPICNVTAHTVTGVRAAPSPLSGLTIATVGEAALLRWDASPDLDVLVDGWIVFRHTPEMTGAQWTRTTTIGRAVKGDQTWAYLPLKPGTYFAVVYDSGGRASTPVSISTAQASVLTYVPVAEVVEHPAFAGVLSGLERADGVLRLSSSGSFDAVPSVDALVSFDNVGSTLSFTGSYRFAAGMDLGTVKNVRLTSRVLAQVYNASDLIDLRLEPIDSWGDIDGTTSAPSDASVWFRQTDDNPAGASPAWSVWNRLDAQAVRARGLQYELRCGTDDRQYNIDVSELSVSATEVA